MGNETPSRMVEQLKDWCDDIVVATALLTRVPMPVADGAQALVRAQRAFPLVGAAIGLAVGWSATGPAEAHPSAARRGGA